MSRLNNKKGSLETKEILELILAVVCTFLLIFLFFKLIAPSFNKDAETAKSYFQTLQGEIEKTDDGGTGEFEIWQPEQEKGAHFYLVYFAEQSRFDWQGINFFSGIHNENYFCVCYVKDEESKCKYCDNLKYPAKGDYFNEVGYAPFVVGRGEKLKITKGDGYYNFLTPPKI